MLSAFYLITGLTIIHASPNYNKRQTSFDSTAQHVDVSGVHRFIAPSSSDLRGPCPALNAAANHGYIARNGYTTIQETNAALIEVYGISLDNVNLFATLGAVQGGDGDHFSIGGPPARGLPIVGGLLGQPRGISNTHNRFESDVSPTRGDLYQFGEAYLTKRPFFQALYDLPGTAANPNYDLAVLGKHGANRHGQSISQNPYYFSGPVSFGVPPAALSLLFRHFANHSAEYPDGFLNRDSLKSFFAMSGPDNALVYAPGEERIPDNWYKRPTPYTFPELVSDIATIFQQNPGTITFGGNTGTGGLYNAANLFEGNNLLCFVYQTSAVAAPSLIRSGGVIADVLSAVAKLNSAVDQALRGLGCPQLSSYDYDDSQLSKYPGWTKLKKDGTY